LLAISSAVSHDLLKNTLMPHISDKTEMLYARISMFGAVVVATWLGLNPPGFAAQTVALAFGIAASSLFPCLILGIFFKRINSSGAVAGMISGALFTIVYIFLYLGWFFIPGTNTFPNTPDNWILGISPLSVGCIGALINFTVGITVSLVTQAPPLEIQEMVRRVRYP
jgi:cation/acetate symporter